MNIISSKKINYSAKLVYGVSVKSSEIPMVREPFVDKWLIYCSLYDLYGEVLVGIILGSANEAESAEVCIETPTAAALKELSYVLDDLGITQKPSWHLVCQVS